MKREEQHLSFCVETQEIGERLDKVITQRLAGAYSRTEIQQLIKDEQVTVNSNQSKAAYKLEENDCVDIVLPEEHPFELVAQEDVQLNILYQDEHIAVVNKTAGMVVHPGHGNEDNTLLNGLVARFPEIETVGDHIERAGIVHRLDKDVSGVLVVALSQIAYDHLVLQFQQRDVKKHYVALVEQHPPNDKGIIDAPIGRDPHHRKRMAVLRDGKAAVTEFAVRDYYGERALLDVFPQTGRTHQIRVHLAFIQCPIVGDQIYGYRKQRIKMKRIFLHAHRLNFEHPMSGERMDFAVSLPKGLENILDKLST